MSPKGLIKHLHGQLVQWEQPHSLKMTQFFRARFPPHDSSHWEKMSSFFDININWHAVKLLSRYVLFCGINHATRVEEDRNTTCGPVFVLQRCEAGCRSTVAPLASHQLGRNIHYSAAPCMNYVM